MHAMRGRLLTICFVFLMTLGYADASDNYTVNHGANLNITAHTECRKVTNASATNASVYVPTRTAAEWQSFRDKPPVGVTATSCGCTLPWGGTLAEGASVTAYQKSSANTCRSEVRKCTNGVLSGSYQYASCADTCAGLDMYGYCWYASGTSQTCNSVCSARGGCNATGLSYARHQDRCTAILAGLGLGSGTASAGQTSISYLSCWIATKYNTRWYHGFNTPRCSEDTSTVQRQACSCNQ